MGDGSGTFDWIEIDMIRGISYSIWMRSRGVRSPSGSYNLVLSMGGSREASNSPNKSDIKESAYDPLLRHCDSNMIRMVLEAPRIA